MTKSNYQLTAICLKLINLLLNKLIKLFTTDKSKTLNIFRACADNSFRSSYPENTDFSSASLKNNMRLYQSCTSSINKHIAGNVWKTSFTYSIGEYILTIIKLMITQSRSIISTGIHEMDS